MERVTLPMLRQFAYTVARDMRDLQTAIRKLDSAEVYSTVVMDKGSKTNGNSWAARIEVWQQGIDHPLYGIRIHAPTARDLHTRLEWYRDGIMCGLRAHWHVSATA